MSAHFDILEDGWIPVVHLDGSRGEYGLRRVLQEAHLLREISIVSPLQEYSVYRFISVFLMDALRPESIVDMEDLLEYGQWDMDAIEEYISLCREEGVSFDLFDKERPFLQMPYHAEYCKKEKSIAALNCMQASGNNHIHFDHNLESAVDASYAETVRLLIAAQIFCTAGAQGYPSNVSGAPPYYSVIRGMNLFQTLVYLMVPLDEIAIPFDEPSVLWRSAEAVVPKKEVGETSWLRGMLFPARGITLVSEPEQSKIQWVYVYQGENFSNKTVWSDPHVAYRSIKTDTVPIRPHKEKPIWRNLCNIMDVSGMHAPKILSVYRRLTDMHYGDITLYGVETSNASFVEAMKHDFRISLAQCEDSEYITFLNKCIQSAESMASTLRNSLMQIQSMANFCAEEAVEQFYKCCEVRFWEYVEAEQIPVPTETYLLWCDEMEQWACSCFDAILKQVRLSGRSMAAAAEQRQRLRKVIQKLKKEVSG